MCKNDKEGGPLSLTIWPGIGQQHFGRDHQRLPHLFVPIRLWGRCRRDLSTTPGLPTMRVRPKLPFHTPICLRPGEFIGVPSAFFFEFVDLSPVLCSPFPTRTLGAYRKNRTRGRENPHKALYAETGNTNHSHARSRRDPLRSFPSSLHDDMEIFSWLVESGTQTLSHFQRIIDLGRGIVIEKCSAFEIPNNVNATARYAIPSGRIN